jgi:thioredoxin 1
MSDYPENLTLKADTKSVEIALDGSLPVLIWLSPEGYSSSSDLRKALEAAATKYKKKLSVFTVDVTENLTLGERFEVGKGPLLVGWYDGEVVKRRNRPWATDVAGIADSLVELLPVNQVVDDDDEALTEKESKDKIVNNKPVAVTDATFEADVLKSEVPVLVDFWAEWCGPCRMVAPVLEKLAGEYAGKVRIAKVDVDSNPGLSNAFQIRSIPTLMFIKQGKIVGQTAGALPEPALRDAIEQLLALEIPAA